jgi:hypothetical protein
VNRFDAIGARARHDEEWWGKLDGEVLDCLTVGPASAEELGKRLGVSEQAAVSMLTMLARDGKVRLSRVELA